MKDEKRKADKKEKQQASAEATKKRKAEDEVGKNKGKKKRKLSSAGNPMVYVQTSEGNFTLEIFEEEQPTTAANFLNLVHDKF